MARTRDWGSKYDAVKNHVGRLSSAMQEHNAALAAERGTHQHAYGRHGWQTGWESQIVRAASGVTPDSAADPYGLNPTLRTWGTVMVAAPGGIKKERYALGNRGQRVVTGFGLEHTPTLNHVPPNRGCVAGQFISPMAQKDAIAAAKTKLTTRYSRYVEGERRKSGMTTWHAVRRLVIVTGVPGNKPIGLSFAFDRTHGTPRAETEVRFLIDAFQRRLTVKQVMHNCPFSGQTTRTATRNALMTIHGVGSVQNLGVYNDTPAFPQMSDLLAAVGVAVKEVKRTLSVWDYDGTNWKLVTCYATDDARELGEYSLTGANGPNGVPTGRLRGGSLTTTGTYNAGKVNLT